MARPFSGHLIQVTESPCATAPRDTFSAPSGQVSGTASKTAPSAINAGGIGPDPDTHNTHARVRANMLLGGPFKAPGPKILFDRFRMRCEPLF